MYSLVFIRHHAVCLPTACILPTWCLLAACLLPACCLLAACCLHDACCCLLSRACRLPAACLHLTLHACWLRAALYKELPSACLSIKAVCLLAADCIHACLKVPFQLTFIARGSAIAKRPDLLSYERESEHFWKYGPSPRKYPPRDDLWLFI
jgi:hypothetical protein